MGAPLSWLRELLVAVQIHLTDMPAVVRVVWPPKPTVIDPKALPTPQLRLQLFARANIVLASLKAHGL
jgi:hypothetical protein